MIYIHAAGTRGRNKGSPSLPSSCAITHEVVAKEILLPTWRCGCGVEGKVIYTKSADFFLLKAF